MKALSMLFTSTITFGNRLFLFLTTSGNVYILTKNFEDLDSLGTLVNMDYYAINASTDNPLFGVQCNIYRIKVVLTTSDVCAIITLDGDEGFSSYRWAAS